MDRSRERERTPTGYYGIRDYYERRRDEDREDDKVRYKTNRMERIARAVPDVDIDDAVSKLSEGTKKVLRGDAGITNTG